MKSALKFIALLVLIRYSNRSLQAQNLSINITKRYLNLPVSQAQNRGTMQFMVNDKPERSFTIRPAADKPNYWVFCDMAALQGKTIIIRYDGNQEGLRKVYQADKIAGQDSLYRENNRPQHHFSTRRGCINDPN